VRRCIAALAILPGLPSIAAAQVGQVYHCDVTHGTSSGVLVITSEVDPEGNASSVAGLWIGNLQPDGGSLQIRWQFANLDVVGADLTISLALRKQAPDGSWLRLWHPNGDRDGLTLSEPLGYQSRSRKVSASVDLATLLAFARGSPKLSWQLVKSTGRRFKSSRDTSGDLDIAPLGDAVAELPAAVAELKANMKERRSRCVLGDVAEII
jgi:hypothetical protein